MKKQPIFKPLKRNEEPIVKQGGGIGAEMASFSAAGPHTHLSSKSSKYSPPPLYNCKEMTKIDMTPFPFGVQLTQPSFLFQS